MRRMRIDAGFTLIEVMVVVVILGILATFVLPNILDRPDQARATKAQQDIRSIEGALQLYRLDNFQFPSQQQGLKALVEKPTAAPVPANWKESGYMDRMPMDPWGNEYKYRNPGTKNPRGIDIYSLGADGAEGGTGTASEVGNWK